MFRLRFILFFTIPFFAGLCMALPKEINGYISEFTRELSTINKRYVASTNALPQQYVKGLKEMEKRFQKSGDLDGLLVVKTEYDRFVSAITGPLDPFELVPEMPDDALVESPEALRAMQDRYLNNKQSIDDGLKSVVEESSDKLLKRIEAIQKNLVIQGKIDEATEVRDIATKVKAAIEDGSITESFTLGEESPKESDEASEDVESVQEETHDRPQPEVTPVRPTERKTRSGLSPWRKWKYVGEKPFSPNLEKIFSVDIHSQMSLRVLDKSGISTFAVDGGAEPQQVGNQFCTWFGRAMIWTADPGDDLSVDLKVTSRKITLSRDSGPHLFVYIYHAGSIVSQIRVPIIHHELELRIVRDTTKKGHYALFWPKGGVSRQFDIVGDEKVTLIFGIAVSGTREQCDTTINFK